MNGIHPKVVVVISPRTRTILETIKTASKNEGKRDTLGGIVDRLVNDEYERTIKKEA